MTPKSAKMAPFGLSGNHLGKPWVPQETPRSILAPTGSPNEPKIIQNGRQMSPKFPDYANVTPPPKQKHEHTFCNMSLLFCSHASVKSMAIRKRGPAAGALAFRYPPPPGLVPGGNGVVNAPSVFNDFPSQVRDFSHGLRGPRTAADPPRSHLRLSP